MENLWIDVADRVKDLSSKPEKFLEASDTIFNKTKILAKVLYDAAKLLEDGKYRNVTLPELIIDNFDEEQVWAGVELQNTAWESDFRDKLEKLETLSIRNPDSFNLLRGQSADIPKSKPVQVEVDSDEEDEDFEFDGDEGGDEEEEELPDKESEGEDDDLSDIEDGRLDNGDNDEGDSDDDPEMKAILNDPDFQHMSDSDGDELPLFGEKDSSDDEEPDLEEEEEKEMKKQEEQEKKNKILTAKADAYLHDALKNIKTSVKGERAQVEDRFFKLDEMEKFLEAEEAKERQDIKLELKGKNKKEAEDDSDDDDEDDDEMDLFDSRLVAEGKEDRAMYKDYFNEQNAPEEDFDEGDEYEEEEEDGAVAGPPAKRMLLDPASSDEEEKDMGEIKSSFEVRSAKLKKEIKKMEEEAISDKKPWQMIGEVNAIKRPENSLLQEHLDYDNVAKQAPIVTEEVSRRLEDIIMQRIKDRAWDDVERKIRPIENPYEYKKKLILDQEKSKLSLAEVYEQEFLKQKGELDSAKKVPGMLDPEEDGPPPEVDGIKRSMKSLFAKLDTLTHFHYTPRMASAEVKIVRNAPTITMEEVAPIAMNDANLLAPQEIVDKKRSEEIGSTEKSETDKKRERRQKKQKQRLREKEKEKKEKLLEKLNPGLGNKHSKKKVLKDIEKAEKEGKLVTIKSKSKSVKSSSAFFNQLQNETMSTLKEKMSQAPKKKKAEKGLSGALLKL